MRNGQSFAHPPTNAEASINIKLYSSLKEKMNSVQHRKLQHLIRHGKEDLNDKKSLNQ
jgi:hypothetical protein